ncbi:putative structure specific recognition protein [Gregarina niphandrodes]|uniref:FACT complex subunit SSRP1 n=1 Tax=Gregarina niphandrodes TaxID=110365 RepID=A0A023BCN2_GRENI|nr:putative structure specific recognition protein [Gregarina niphandrodes]EZG83910.1 putative structure specific recognition protein [Gregarina niphandrodes]|eukprot:XP_011128909.1 putative structure specific recognition protein [Gregarina niphandrodes]
MSVKTEQVNIKNVRGPGTPDTGAFRITKSLYGWKNSNTGQIIQEDAKAVRQIEWSRINAREFTLSFVTQSGTRIDFSGFREHDFETLQSYFKRHWQIPMLADIKLGCKGWHWGEWSIKDKSFCFEVDGKRSIDIPLDRLSNVMSNKSDITLELKTKEKQSVMEDVVSEIRFCVPPPKEGDAADNAEYVKAVRLSNTSALLFFQSILDASGLGSSDNTSLVCRFLYKNCLLPPGRFDVQFYANSIRLHGKSFDYRVQFDNIIDAYFLVDEQSSKLLLTLVNPLKKGATKYPAVIICFDDKQEQVISINASAEMLEEIRKFMPSAQSEMSVMENILAGPLIQALAKKQILGETPFKGSSNWPSFSCSHKVETGWFYPLQHEFVYLHKPVITVKFSEVASVNLGRTQGQQTRLFEFSITLKSGIEYEFNQVDRAELQPFVDFVKSQGLKLREMVTESREDHMEHGNGGREDESDNDDEEDDEDFEVEDEEEDF